MKICLILEGSYPYVHGGVSSWTHQYISELSEHQFVLWLIGAKAEDRGKFVYQLPANVTEVHEVFLDDALRLPSSRKKLARFTDEEFQTLKALLNCQQPDWDILFDLFQTRRLDPMAFLQSNRFLSILTDLCLEKYPYTSFSSCFHTIRSMLLPVLYILGTEVPEADVYHAIATGYADVLAAMGSHIRKRPLLLTEHGIYTREREEEIIRAQWVVPEFKSRWIRFFYMLSDAVYRRAQIVTSLFSRARETQIEMSCRPERCRVIANGIHFDRFSAIPLKPEDGWVDIGAVVRIAPIKDLITMIYAFFELKSRMPNVRLHILGGVDDPEYDQECRDLAAHLGVQDLIFTGRVDVVSYMEKLDFTVLTSISEGQPLSVLESLAAGRPCVTTDVGCCRELLDGEGDDPYGLAGYHVPPMHRDLLADALENMCRSRERRLMMGENGRKRVAAYYTNTQMIENYRQMYREVEENGGNRI